MAIDNALLEHWMEQIASIKGIQMDPDALVDDVVCLAVEFSEPEEFNIAMTNIVAALQLIVRRRNIGQPLTGNLRGWISYHFQSKRVQHHPADLRAVYMEVSTEVIRVRGFGHRWQPQEIYKRLYGRL